MEGEGARPGLTWLRGHRFCDHHDAVADAAKHAIENPFLHPMLGERQILVTLVILTVLGAVFLKGFTEAIGLATAAAVPYLALNLVVLMQEEETQIVRQWRKSSASERRWSASCQNYCPSCASAARSGASDN